jgi:hypothetical protein
MAKNEQTKEIAMTARLKIALCCFVALQAGCVNPGYVDEPNEVPVALARVVGPMGPTAMMVTIPFAAPAVAVTLDGAGSTDKDGRIASYQWIATKPMMPMERIIVAGASPQVTLDQQGTWTFSLWVTDDKGVVSRPAKVTFIVGMPSMPMGGAGGAGGASGGAGGAGGAAAPALTADMCVAMVAPAVPMPCKTCICAIESCRQSVIMSSCNEACWALLACIGENCPASPTCVGAGMPCAAAFATYMMNGNMGATAAGGCATMCATDC